MSEEITGIKILWGMMGNNQKTRGLDLDHKRVPGYESRTCIEKIEQELELNIIKLKGD